MANAVFNMLHRREVCGRRDIVTQWAADLFASRTSMPSKDCLGHYGCVNAVEFSPGSEDLIASGGDDHRVLLWNTGRCLMQARPQPIAVMKGEHSSNIFALAFTNDAAQIFSGGNDEVVVQHDVLTQQVVNLFNHRAAVVGVDVHPQNDRLFLSVCDVGMFVTKGRAFICDSRSSDRVCLAKSTDQFSGGAFHPCEPRLVALSNTTDGAFLMDTRLPNKPVLRYNLSGCGMRSKAMGIQFNSAGTQVFVLNRRGLPTLFDTGHATPVCTFDHSEYENLCTMKSGCFAGDRDQFVVSGSDSFNVFVWKIPDIVRELAHGPHTSTFHASSESAVVLRGHRSIVNQARYSKQHFALATSGVEKMVKLWTPFMVISRQGRVSGSGLDKDLSCPTSTRGRLEFDRPQEQALMLSMWERQVMPEHAEDTTEDTQMLALFDTLIQAEQRSDGNESTGGVSFDSSSADSSEDSEGEGLTSTASGLTDDFSLSGSDDSSRPSPLSSSDESNEGSGRLLIHFGLIDTGSSSEVSS